MFNQPHPLMRVGSPHLVVGGVVGIPFSLLTVLREERTGTRIANHSLSRVHSPGGGDIPTPSLIWSAHEINTTRTHS